jgi:hypothetical protein
MDNRTLRTVEAGIRDVTAEAPMSSAEGYGDL